MDGQLPRGPVIGVQVKPAPISRYPGLLKLLNMVVRNSPNEEMASLSFNFIP